MSKDAGVVASPELEALYATAIKDSAWAMAEAGKSALYSNLARVSSKASYAVRFIEEQSKHPCPHGGTDGACECYPHQARRWMAETR